jgi:hypothetical protein
VSAVVRHEGEKKRNAVGAQTKGGVAEERDR